MLNKIHTQGIGHRSQDFKAVQYAFLETVKWKIGSFGVMQK